VIYGSVCAPHMVPFSVYLPHILGTKMELPDPQVAERVLSLLYSLHNQLAELVEDNERLYVRRRVFESDQPGLLLHASDLWREVVGFRKGLALGTETEDDLPEAAHRAYEQLADEQDSLMSVMRRIDAKRKSFTAQESEQRH